MTQPVSWRIWQRRGPTDDIFYSVEEAPADATIRHETDPFVAAWEWAGAHQWPDKVQVYVERADIVDPEGPRLYRITSNIAGTRQLAEIPTSRALG
jgi:hypothetical protein